MKERMEWFEAVELVKRHVVQVSTPRGVGTGFYVASAPTGLCAIATAAHVVSDSLMWEEPIRILHPDSGESRILRVSDRHIEPWVEMDTATLTFELDGFPFPDSPLEFIEYGKFLKVGNQVGWLGFPSVSPGNVCFFTGTVSAFMEEQRSYLVDGVAIHGVSGGPAFGILGERLMMVGVVSAYIPNLATGETLPGVSVVRDVAQFQELAKHVRTLDEAAKKGPPSPIGFPYSTTSKAD